MALELDDLTFIESLWEHQVEAIKVINEYVSKNDQNWEESCMIALPTGVGKTGIIATFAHFSTFNKILILSPRASITTQNFDNIKGAFFEKLGYQIESDKNVLNKMPQSPSDGNFIIVSTIQKIGDMYRRDIRDIAPPNGECQFHELVREIDLLIIDEGHWEPADTWKNFLRSFDCPKILFTATPIRNDYSEFDVKKDGYFYTKPISDFQRERYLKNVKFHTLEKQDTVEEFTAEIKRLRRVHHQATNKKVLIRCENSSEIRFLVEAFSKEFPSEKVIGIHVNFPSSEAEGNKFFSNKTPVTEEEKDKFDIWIHQYKMVEGFDEPRFGYLVLFSPFSNVRQLAQQVGRILRNPNRRRGEVGHVFTPLYGRQFELWENYLIYDNMSEDDKISVLNTMDFDYSAKIFKDTDLVYIDNLFRKSFDKVDEPFEVDERFKLPLSCNIKARIHDTSKIDVIYKEVIDRFLTTDVEILFKGEYEAKSFVICYLEINNSPYLKFEQVIETKTNIIYFRELDDYFLYYCSSSSFNQFFDDLSYSKNVPQASFRKLIASNTNSRISNVYLKNSAVSSVQYSSKKLWANDIGKVAPSFDDSFHTLSNLWGFSYGPKSSPDKDVLVPLVGQNQNEVVRRYLGHKKGRITQDGSVRYNINEYNQWSNNIVDILDGSTSGHDLFHRFAEEVSPPDTVEAYLIAFDFDLLMNYFSGKIVKVDSQNVLTEVELFSMSNYCFEVDVNNEFTIKSDELSRHYTLEIFWDSTTNKFTVISREDDPNSLDKFYIYDSNSKKLRTLLEIINSKQAFKIFLKGADALMFVDKKFIKPNFRTSSNINETNDPVMSVLKEVNCFNTIIDEKGHSSPVASWNRVRNNWPTDSLFGLLSRQGNGSNDFVNIFQNVETIICDDMDTESADFIVATDKRVSLIHAKASKNLSQTGSSRKCGASNVNDVVSQGIKNLNIINLFDPKTPKHVARWGTQNWEGRGNGVGHSVNRRLLPTSGSGLSLWKNRILPKIKDPNIDKYVVCVLSNSLNKQYFQNQLNNSAGTMHTESVHTYFLLLNLINMSQQLGVKVEIYCNP